ncbi:MAG: hypothetical protein DRO89_05565, partial [Candidatus Altiarchaeales archaeon]
MVNITRPNVHISVPKDSGIVIIHPLPLHGIPMLDNDTYIPDVTSHIGEKFITKNGMITGERSNPILYRISNIPEYVQEIHLTIGSGGSIGLYLNKDNEGFTKTAKTSVKTSQVGSTSETTNMAWPMFHHDLRHTGHSLSSAPKTSDLAWSYTTRGGVWSSPAVADGMVFVGSRDNKVYALNESTGALIWSYTTGDQVWSSPAVANGMIFIGSNDGKLYAFGQYQPPAIPDLTLTRDDITFSPSSPVEGDLVTINATVHNIGDGNAE